MFPAPPPSNAAMKEQQSDSAYVSSVFVQPILGAAWRGRFNIPSLKIDINVAAHVSNNACLKVLEVANIMPESLHLEIIPRHDAWPSSFEMSPPTEHSIALIFFPEKRDEEVLDNLLSHTICSDFAFKAMIGKAELLIFTSLQLPRNLHRFQGKLYFWGVFREQHAADSHQSYYHAHAQNIRAKQTLSPNSENQMSFKLKGSPRTISSKNSPSTEPSKPDRRGRRLDNAWEHAKPLDVLRQKAECRYCGFVSSHGGISRLKAHLGGGSPGITLPGCDKVSPEVKKVMAEWFSEWLKNAKALWVKDIKAGSAAHVDKRRVKPLDVACQRSDYKYPGSESLPGKVSYHEVNLGGGHSKMHEEDQPKVLMNEWVKSSTSATKKLQAAGERLETRGRRRDDAWQHAMPLDETRQKTQCNYCGFVSLYGGISRLKAHLGGGCPQVQLQGCPQVSLEVKRVMEHWFNEWVKTSAATWIGKSHASPGSSKRGRPLDGTWDHAIPLDETRQATKCKYCGFISRFGGIARLKAHLAGGDPIMQLEGCPNISPDVKKLMAGGTKKYKKKPKTVFMDSSGGILQESGRTPIEAQRFEIRHHILQETLDEISNTSLKGRLQKLIDKKSNKLRKMEFEVQSLGHHLASIP